MKCHLCNQQIDETQIWWMKDGVASHDVCPKTPTMKTKHTATPWQTGALMTRVEVLPEGWNAPLCIADCHAKNAPRTEAERVANAQFITLACNHHEELVAALELALFTMEGLKRPCPHEQTQRTRSVIRSLLTKLKG